MAEDALLARVNGLAHEVELLRLGLQELNDRLDSVPRLTRLLADHEDLIRRRDSGDEDLVG